MQSTSAFTGCSRSTGFSLQQVINSLIRNFHPEASRSHTMVLNEVGRDVMLHMENSKTLDILRELLSSVIVNSRNGEIHITADRYQDMISISIQERNNYNGYALEYSVGSISPEAVMVGGYISIKEPTRKVATVTFSFPNTSRAAA